MMTSCPFTMQKNDLPIPSFPFDLISNKPPLSAFVYGDPNAGPNSSIISAICKKLAKIPEGNSRVSDSTFGL